MILPSEKALRAVLARFAQASIDHDGSPTERTGSALADVTYTLCVMTGARTSEQALLAADALMARFRADREQSAHEHETLII